MIRPTRSRTPARRLLGGLSISTVLALSACGGSGDGQPVTAPAGSASSAALPATVAHKFGTTTVRSAPERVVAVGYNDQDFALALGVRPVGARQFVGGRDVSSRPWAQAALGGTTPEAIGAEEIELEKVAALRPDLILGVYSGITKQQYGLLSRIAPTIAQTDDVADFGEPWQRQTLQTGEALGRTARAKRIVAATEARFAKVEAKEGFTGRTLVMASGSTSQIAVYASEDLRSRFFAELGFVTPKRIDRMARKLFYANLSEERLGDLDADVLVIYGDERSLLRKPAFASLKVVREGRVVYLDETSDLADALGSRARSASPTRSSGPCPCCAPRSTAILRPRRPP